MIEEAWHLQIVLFQVEKLRVLVGENVVSWFPDTYAIQQHDTESEQSSLGAFACSCSPQPLIANLLIAHPSLTISMGHQSSLMSCDK